MRRAERSQLIHQRQDFRLPGSRKDVFDFEVDHVPAGVVEVHRAHDQQHWSLSRITLAQQLRVPLGERARGDEPGSSEWLGKFWAYRLGNRCNGGTTRRK